MKQILALFTTVISHRHLLSGFVMREIKGRFAGSIGGWVWTVLTPLANIAAYFFVFSVVMRIPVTIEEAGTDKYAVFFLCGYFPWLMFSDSLSKSVNILVSEAGIITKVVFPVELLPISVVSSSFLINSIGFLLLLLYLVVDGYLSAAWLFIPFAVAVEILFVLGLAFFLSAMCVFIRDIGELLGIVIMLWFFATPIIYPAYMVPKGFAFIFTINPMAECVTLFRKMILMGVVDFHAFFIIACCAVASYCVGAWFFLRSKNAFGDVL